MYTPAFARILAVVIAVIALADPGSSPSVAASIPVVPAPTAVMSADLVTVNSLLLGQEFSIFYGGFE